MSKLKAFDSVQTGLVLQALLDAPSGETYGFELGRVTGLKAGTLYPILQRLLRHGCIADRWETIDGSVHGAAPADRRRSGLGDGGRDQVRQGDRAQAPANAGHNVSTASPHLCAEPGCPNIIDGPGRCPDHTNTADRWHDWEQRNHPGAYGHTWRQTRAAYLTKHPTCKRCHVTPATEVHHLDHNPRNNDWSNLAALCTNCHRSETARHSAAHRRLPLTP